MRKCLKLTFLSDSAADALHTFVQKQAQSFSLEGTVQTIEDNQYRIIVCGPKEAVDSFVDMLHKGTAAISLEDIEIEPFLTDKDYRNVFRVIE